MKEKYDRISAKCSKAITQFYSTSFSLGIQFLNKKFHEPIYAIYGFVRLADEIVDSFHNYNKAALLAKFKQDCFDAIDNGISLNPVLNAFQHTVRTYNIERALIDTFLESMEMDLYESRYTEENYDVYILGSAQVVGLMCLHVFTEGNRAYYEQLKTSAMKLGSAFQKVNFLRDLNSDFTVLKRIYFPGLDVVNFSEADKIKIEQNIECEFNEALSGIRKLPKSSGKGVYLAYTYYVQLFKKIKRFTPGTILTDRVRISNTYKLALLIKSLLRYNINAI